MLLVPGALKILGVVLDGTYVSPWGRFIFGISLQEQLHPVPLNLLFYYKYIC